MAKGKTDRHMMDDMPAMPHRQVNMPDMPKDHKPGMATGTNSGKGPMSPAVMRSRHGAAAAQRGTTSK